MRGGVFITPLHNLQRGNINEKTLFIFLLFSLLIVNACQQTPEAQNVAGKQDIYTLTRQKTVAPYTYEYEQNLKLETDTPTEGLTIKIDAAVKVPDTQLFPVYSVRPLLFEKQKSKELIDYLAPNAKFYAGAYEFTKEQLIEQLATYSQLKLYDDDEDQQYKDEMEAMRQEYIEDYKKRIAQAQPQTERAYLKFDQIVKPGTQNILDDDTGGYGVIFGEGCDAALYVQNRDGNYRSSTFYFNKGGFIQEESLLQSDGKTVGEVNITKSEAVDKAQQTLRDLGVEGLTLVMAEKAQQYDRVDFEVVSKGYYMFFRRTIKGMDTVYIGTRVGTDPDNEPEFIPPWKQEEIVMFISEHGIEYFYWGGLSEIKDTVSENVQLLSFEDIKQRIAQQIRYKHMWIGDEQGAVMSINVDRVVLGLAMISAKDNLEEGLLVPAWYALYDTVLDGNDYEDALVLNAIDGSVIEPRLDAYMMDQQSEDE